MESSKFQPPQRASLTDAELLAAIGENHLDEASMLAAMNLLENQSALRAAEDVALSNWQDEMLRDGSPMALRALENLRRVNDGLEPLVDLNNQPEPELPAQPLLADSSGGVADALNALYGTATVVSDVDFEEMLADRKSSASTGSAEENSTAFEEMFPTVGQAPNSAQALKQTVHRPASGASVWLHAFGWTAYSLSLLPALLAVSFLAAGYSVAVSFWGLTVGIIFGSALVSLTAIGSIRVGLSAPLLSRVAFGIRANAVPLSLLSLIRLVALSGLLFFSLEVVRNVGKVTVIGFSGEDITVFSNLTIPFEVPAGLVAVMVALSISIIGRRTRIVTALTATVIGIATVVASFSMKGVAGLQSTAISLQSDGGSVLQVAGLVLALFAVFWLPAAGDFSKNVRADASKASVFFTSFLSVGLLPLAVAFLSLEAFSDAIAELISSNTNVSLSQLTVLLIQQSPAIGVGFVLSLLAIFSIVLKSVGVTLQSLFALKSNRLMQVSAAIFAVVASSWIAVNLKEDGFFYNAHDYALVVAVPVLAWFGIYLADSLLRRSAIHTTSVTRSYGYYKNVSVGTLIVFVISSVLGLGFIQSDLIEFEWTGYFFDLLGAGDQTLFASAGLWVSLIFSTLALVAIGIPRIRSQETEIAAIEARRNELANIFDMGD